MNRLHSFPPLIDAQSHTLILGSLPGEESLRRQQYYAHPRNAFWRIVYGIFGNRPDENYAQRCEFILSHNLALWDVCRSAERVGSADSKLAAIEPNDIAGLLIKYPNIRKIVLNGRKAETEYRRYFSAITASAFYAPSTSPAYAALSFDRKLSEWRRGMNL